MEVFCFHRLSQVEWWADELEQLNLASRRKDPFSTFGFIRGQPAAEGQPWFLLAVENGLPIGYLALRRREERVLGLQAARLELFAAGDSQLVARAEDESRVSAAFYQYLISRADEWSLLELQQQDPASALTPPPPGRALEKYFTRTLPTQETNTLPVSWRSLEAYLEALRPRFRLDLERKARRLLGAGEAGWLESDDPGATVLLRQLLRRCPAVGKRPEPPAGLIRTRVGVLLLEGIPVAGSSCGEYAQTIHRLDVRVDPRCAHLEPGVVIQLMVIRAAIARGSRALTLASGDQPRASRWLAEATPTRTGQLFRIGKPHYWQALAGEFSRRLAARIAVPAEDQPPRRSSRRASARARAEARARAAPPLRPSDQERSEVEAVLARLEALPVDRLDHEALLAALPLARPPAEAERPSEELAAQPPPGWVSEPEQLAGW